MAKIPEQLHEYINFAFPQNVCFIATVSSDGIPSIGPKGSMMVFDGDTLAFWERTMRNAWENIKTNPNVMVIYRNPELRQSGLLPAGGIARIWGTAEIHEDGPTREAVWERVIEQEKNQDPDKKGAAVLIKIEKAEHLNGNPLDSA